MAIDISETIGDLNAQENGVKREYRDGIHFQIAYSGNKKYRNYLQQRMTQARRGNRNRDLPPEVTQEITVEAMAKHIVKGWDKGAFTDGGKPFEYSPENALELLKKSSEIRDFVSEESNDGAIFGIGKKEESAAIADTKSRP
jgi:hypothetical protein